MSLVVQSAVLSIVGVTFLDSERAAKSDGAHRG